MTLPMYGYAWRSRDNGRTGVELFSEMVDRDREMVAARDDWSCDVVPLRSTLDLDPATLFPGIPEFETGPVEVEPPFSLSSSARRGHDRPDDTPNYTKFTRAVDAVRDTTEEE